MLKKISISLMSVTSIIPIIATTTSCSESNFDYKVMNFIVDENKLKEEYKNIDSFNKLPNDENKLKKVITTSWIDGYTSDALIKGLMSISLKEENNNKYLEINLNTKDEHNKNKHYSYRLPNGGTNQKWYFK